MEEIIRDLYCEICGPIRNKSGAMVSLVEFLKNKEDSLELPDFVKGLVDAAYSAKEDYMQSNERISKILGRLPPDKLKEFGEYMVEYFKNIDESQ